MPLSHRAPRGSHDNQRGTTAAALEPYQ
jgi:hypothetical protein